ncbi:Asp/Glu racemase [Streptomonospora nanhaiensis]|uniref:Maleate isomerase n=1 Tax=Streptomonospora nanhaiensis TaxID=1323731 RepID=A0A853BQW0_9ACTN|nr:Asp/Glu racemase [Streptomonospora nanhaiensis]MBX9389398.1 Asp/Glu racemase [Streptomonospora nanhaiensis]NYI96947.1 maleate isomerase [Streptomonospora nanhaiensis]
MRTDRTAGAPVSGDDQGERVILDKHVKPAGHTPDPAPTVVELSAVAETPWQSGVGIVAPYDFALDRELWRWAPDDVSLYVTRLPFVPVPVTVDQASALSDGANVARATRDLLAPEPLVVGYACASGSFVHGADGQRRLRQCILDAGAPEAVTTSGALIQALEALDLRRIAVVTPYVDSVTGRLLNYLAEHGVESVSSVGLGLLGHIWKTTYSEVVQAVRDADRPDAQAVFISCTNVLTYDIIAPLERMLGKPVIAANQVTMWAALQAMGRQPVAHGQHLVDATARTAA